VPTKQRFDHNYVGQATLPSDEVLKSKEEADRARFREMMVSREQVQIETADEADYGSFAPVMSSAVSDVFQPNERRGEKPEAGLTERLGNLLKRTVSSTESDESDVKSVSINDQDMKGRYYYDKFGFSPFDAAGHKALRKAYIEGLVWNLKYYYEGCVSWSWYYPFHYGAYSTR